MEEQVIQETKEKEMTQKVCIKKNPPLIKQLERRKKVLYYIGKGYRRWEIAEVINCSEKTVERDLAWIFSKTNQEEERKNLLESIKWDLKQASDNYENSKGNPRDMAMWLHLKNQINRTKAIYMKDQTVNIIGTQNNQINSKLDMNIILKQVKEEQEKIRSKSKAQRT